MELKGTIGNKYPYIFAVELHSSLGVVVKFLQVDNSMLSLIDMPVKSYLLSLRRI